MGTLGTTCIVLLFSMWIVMFIGTSDSPHPLGGGFLAFYSSITETGLQGFLNFVTSNILVGGALTIGSGLLAYFITSSLAFTIRITIMTSLGSFLFAPFSGFLGEISGGCAVSSFGCIPVEIVWLVTGIFSMLIFLAVIAYASGGDF